MSKVATSPVNKSKSKNMLSQYSKEDIAIGFIIGLQCTLALSVILYHVF